MSTKAHGWATGLLSIPLALVKAWAMCLIWKWFIVPQFGVAELTIRAAIGLSCLAAMLQYFEVKPAQTDKERLEAFGGFLGRQLFLPLAAVCIGYLWYKLLP